MCTLVGPRPSSHSRGRSDRIDRPNWAFHPLAGGTRPPEYGPYLVTIFTKPRFHQTKPATLR